jgi:2'-5' RNA ligase
MSDTLRAFFALPLPESALAALGALDSAVRREAERAGMRLRWALEDEHHVTVKFLGQVERRHVPALAAVVSARAAERAAIVARVGPPAVFGGPRRARVLFATVTEPDAGSELRELAGLLEAEGERFGVPREERPFVPHVTLGRFEQPSDATRLLRAPFPAPFTLRFEELRLYESAPSRPERGPRYTVLAAARFATEPSPP